MIGALDLNSCDHRKHNVEKRGAYAYWDERYDCENQRVILRESSVEAVDDEINQGHRGNDHRNDSDKNNCIRFNFDDFRNRVKDMSVDR